MLYLLYFIIKWWYKCHFRDKNPNYMFKIDKCILSLTVFPSILEAVGRSDDAQVDDAQEIAQIEVDQLMPQVHKTCWLKKSTFVKTWTNPSPWSIFNAKTKKTYLEDKENPEEENGPVDTKKHKNAGEEANA